MTSIRAYDISEQMYVVREEQIVENFGTSDNSQLEDRNRETERKE